MCKLYFTLRSYLKFSELEDRKCVTEGDDSFNSMSFLCFLLIMWLCKATSPMLEISIALLQTTHIALDFDVGSAAIQALNFSFAFPFPLKTHFPIITKRKNSQRRTTASA